MPERPTKVVKKKQLAAEVTEALINSNYVHKNSQNTEKKYSKLIVWDFEMKDVLEKEARKRGLSVTALIKYCVAKGISNDE